MIDTNGHGRVGADEVVVALTPRTEKWCARGAPFALSRPVGPPALSLSRARLALLSSGARALCRRRYALHRALFHTADPDDEYRAMTEAIGTQIQGDYNIECVQS